MHQNAVCTMAAVRLIHMHSCVDSILVNGVGELYCPGADFLTDQIVEGLKKPPSPPDMRVTDKGLV